MEQELSRAAVALVGVAAVGSLGTWAIVAQRLRQYGEVIPSSPRVSVPWTGWQVMWAIFLFFAMQVAAVAASGVKVPLENQPAEQIARLIAFSRLFSLLAIALAAVLIALLSRAEQQDFGLSADHGQVLRDIVLGAFGFMAATLPVLGVQYIVSMLVEYDHVVLDMLGAGATDQLWLVAVLSAVVVAPLTEEFLFRVLLQGWLERLALGRETGLAAPADERSESEQQEDPFAAEPDRMNPYAAGGAGFFNRKALVREPVPARAVWPIWASATLFALMHLGQGAAPIPLLLLGAILGYLYRQTHRLVPCVVLHALFNLFSLVIYRLSVQL
jgi:membrane protease YdiL (CAAX protease family)